MMLPNLSTLLIKQNQIAELDEFLGFGKMKNLKVLDFSGNPLPNLKKPLLVL